MGAVRSLCKTGVVLENGMVAQRGLIEQSIQYYSKGNPNKNVETILSGLKVLSGNICITRLVINNSEANEIKLPYPNRTINVHIEGEALVNMMIGVDIALYDSNDILLSKFAPSLYKDPQTVSGKFKIEEQINLPENICNGEYSLQLELTYPNVS